MPRGKELEQLPMANMTAGAGKDHGKSDWGIMDNIEQNERPQPSEVDKENEDMM